MIPEMQQLIDDLKAKGYLVYGPENIMTYVWFTEPDGKRIGYAQYSRLEGLKYSTVHKPDKYNGTGFGAPNPEEALMGAPSWARTASAPIKYPNFESFRKQHWQKLVQY